MIPIFIYLLIYSTLLLHPIENKQTNKMERCIVEIQAWMTTNKLKLNGDKTQ